MILHAFLNSTFLSFSLSGRILQNFPLYYSDVMRVGWAIGGGQADIVDCQDPHTADSSWFISGREDSADIFKLISRPATIPSESLRANKTLRRDVQAGGN